MPRAVAGIFLTVHGSQKITNPFGAAEMVEGLGFYPGAFWSLLLACTEFFGGILIAIGFLTRIAFLFRRNSGRKTASHFSWNCIFVSSQFRAENRFTLFLELLKNNDDSDVASPFAFAAKRTMKRLQPSWKVRRSKP
ncbi:DoxX family protein [Mesorhizobium sp. ORM6]